VRNRGEQRDASQDGPLDQLERVPATDQPPRSIRSAGCSAWKSSWPPRLGAGSAPRRTGEGWSSPAGPAWLGDQVAFVSSGDGHRRKDPAYPIHDHNPRPSSLTVPH